MLLSLVPQKALAQIHVASKPLIVAHLPADVARLQKSIRSIDRRHLRQHWGKSLRKLYESGIRSSVLRAEKNFSESYFAKQQVLSFVEPEWPLIETAFQ